MKELKLKPDEFLRGKGRPSTGNRGRHAPERAGRQMPDKYGYSKQKLYEAVTSLAGTGKIQERLTFAALPLVILNTPFHENPPDVRDELDAIVKRLTVKPLSNDSGYMPRDVSDEEGNEMSQQILSLFVRVMGGL
jgi:hypothetical protein